MIFGGIWTAAPVFVNTLGLCTCGCAVASFLFIFLNTFDFVLRKKEGENVLEIFTLLEDVDEKANFWLHHAKYTIIAGILLAITITLFYLYIAGEQNNLWSILFVIPSIAVIVLVIILLAGGKSGFLAILIIFTVWSFINMIFGLFRLLHDYCGVPEGIVAKFNSFFQSCQGNVSFYVSRNLTNKSYGKMFAWMYDLSAVADFVYALLLLLNFFVFNMNNKWFLFLGILKAASGVLGSIGFYAMFCMGQETMVTYIELILYNVFIASQMLLIHFRLASIIHWKAIFCGLPTLVFFGIATLVFLYNIMKTCLRSMSSGQK